MLPPWLIEKQKQEREDHRQEQRRPALHIEAPRPTIEDFRQEQTENRRDEDGRAIIDFSI